MNREPSHKPLLVIACRFDFIGPVCFVRADRGDGAVTPQAQLLALLAAGACSYAQIRHIDNVDSLLKLLLKSHQVVMYPATDRIPARFGLFKAANDDPLPPSKPTRPLLKLRKPVVYGDTKVCRQCNQEKSINSFGWYGERRARKPNCYSCVYKRKKLRGAA